MRCASYSADPFSLPFISPLRSSTPPLDVAFKYSEKPFRYLGILFDARLKLKDQLEHVYRKVNIAFAMINRTLKHCWHITAATVYNIYDAAFLWLRLLCKQRDKLEKQYSKIFRTILSCPRDTGSDYLYLQFNTYAQRGLYAGNATDTGPGKHLVECPLWATILSKAELCEQ